MSVLVRIPTPLRRFVGGSPVLEVNGETVSQVLGEISQRYPGVAQRLYDGGTLRPFINIYVNNEDIRFLDGEGTRVKDGDVISIVPAIAGG